MSDWVSRVPRLEAIEEIKQLQVAPPDARDPGWMGRNEVRWLLGVYDDRYVCDNGVCFSRS